MSPARRLVNKTIFQFSRITEGKVLFVGVHSQLDLFYREMFKGLETLDVRPEVKPDIVGDIQYCPQIPDGSYAGVIMVGVYEYLHSPQKAFSEINRITKNDGKVLLGLPGEAFYVDKPTMTPERIFTELKPLLPTEILMAYYRTSVPYYFSILANKT